MESFCPPHPQSGAGDMEMPGVRPSVRRPRYVVSTILKIAAKMATIMAAMAAIFKSHLSLSHSSGRKSSKYQSNFAQFRI
jgi:hypothetical protein